MDKSVDGPDRKKRKKLDTESNLKTEIGVEYGSLKRLDMFELLESCSKSRSRSMVEDLVSKASADLTIDGDCLNLYPLERFDHFYQLIGTHVTTLTVDKVTEFELQGLSSQKNIRDLHLERVMLLDLNLAVVFPNLRSLKLTECAIRDETMSEILSAINSELRLHLHLNMTTIGNWLSYYPWNHDKVAEPPERLLPRSRITDDNRDIEDYPIFYYQLPETPISHLTLERYSAAFVELNGTAESIRIVDCGDRVTMTRIKAYKDEVTYFNLKCLSLETIESVLDFVANASKLGVGDSLASLTLSHLFLPMDWLRELKKLKHLRISLPIQTYQQVALKEALSAMDNEINVEYSDMSPKPHVDQIIDILNDDCLREIVSFLTMEDVFNLAMTHSRFKRLVASIDVSSIDKSVSIDEEFLSRHPPHQQLIGYESIGYSLSTLLLRFLEGGFTTLLPFFANLRSLNFSYSDVKWTDQAIEVFPAVETLVFEYDEHKIPMDMFTKLIRKLKPSIKVLYIHFEPVDFQFLEDLHGLKELGISRTILNRNVHNFWKQNPTLEVLALQANDDNPRLNRRNQERNWNEIASLEYLSVLEVVGFGFKFNESLPVMKHVKELTLDCLDERVYGTFLKCAGTGSQLEKLTLAYRSLAPYEIIATISDLKSLRYFEYSADGDDTLSVQHVIQWMTALPLLSVIQMEAQMEFYRDFEDLLSFLSASKRVLYFNGVKYPL